MQLPDLIGGVYCGREHLAAAAGVALGSLGPMVSNEQLPPMPSPMEERVTGRYAWTLSDVEAYAAACERWRANADARNALKRQQKAVRDRIEQNRIDEEAARLAKAAAAAKSDREWQEKQLADRAEQERVREEQAQRESDYYRSLGSKK